MSTRHNNRIAAWEVAMVYLANYGSTWYVYLGDFIQRTGLTGMDGDTPGQSMGKFMREKFDIFAHSNNDGHYELVPSAKVSPVEFAINKIGREKYQMIMSRIKEVRKEEGLTE